MRRAGIDAELRVAYGGALAARSVLNSLEPDNKFAPDGLDIKGKVRGKRVIISIHCERGMPSLINTLEDLLACLGVAEEGLSSLKVIRRSGPRINTGTRGMHGKRRSGRRRSRMDERDMNSENRSKVRPTE